MNVLAEVKFFASCALGAEEVLRDEIEALRPFCLDLTGRPSTAEFRVLTVDQGGVEFETSLEVGLALNHWLKTANRIWLRRAAFPAKSPARMQERLRSLDVSKYFGNEGFRFEVEAHRCQIHNEKQIRRWGEDIFKIDPQSPFELFLRGVNDEWVVSIDTSGEHLHKRGQRPHAGVAPLRETLAAYSLRLLLRGVPWSRRLKTVVLDPMTGSGSFLREAWGLERPVTSRGFAFQKFKNCPKILLSDSYFKNLHPDWRMDEAGPWAGLVGGEIDSGLEPILDDLTKQTGAQVYFGDSLLRQTRGDWNLPLGAHVWMLVNPPYGERLEGLEWIEKLPVLCRKLSIEKLLLWCPESRRSSVLKSFGVAPVFEQRMSNGGIPVAVMIWEFVKSATA